MVAADTFFKLVDDQDQTIEQLQTQSGSRAQLLVASLSDSVEFMQSLMNELSTVDFPPCANTARDLMLSYMLYRIRVAQNVAAGDQTAYQDSLDQATTYQDFLERELRILGVQIN